MAFKRYVIRTLYATQWFSSVQLQRQNVLGLSMMSLKVESVIFLARLVTQPARAALVSAVHTGEDSSIHGVCSQHSLWNSTDLESLNALFMMLRTSSYLSTL